MRGPFRNRGTFKKKGKEGRQPDDRSGSATEGLKPSATCAGPRKSPRLFAQKTEGFLYWSLLRKLHPFIVKGGDPAALSSTATLLRLHPPH